MSKFLKRPIDTVFLMLGNSCNLNCRYCLQHPLVTKPLSTEINPEIYDFLKECSSDLPEGQKLHVHFYGGEPLIYLPDIKEIVPNIKDFCRLSIISNGKAATPEIIDFLNDNKIRLTVSWDGRNVLNTRGFDVFAKDSPQRELLLKADALHLTGVLTSQAYPKEMLEDFQGIVDAYYAVKGRYPTVNIDDVFDTGCVPADLLNIDYEKVEKEMFQMAMEYLVVITGKRTKSMMYAKFRYLDQLYWKLKNFYGALNGVWPDEWCCCGNGIRLLNMDLQGNLYPCHNTSESCGTINDNYFGYLRRVLAGDHTRQHPECEKCLALAYCRGGCKLVGDKARTESYCKLKRAVFTPVISIFQEFGRLIGGDENG